MCSKPILFHVVDRIIQQLGSEILSSIHIVYSKALDEYNFKRDVSARYVGVGLVQLDHDTQGAAETVYFGIKALLSSDTITIESKVVTMDCDTFYLGNVHRAVESFEGSGVVYFNQSVADASCPFSYVRMDDRNQITEIAEKKRISDHANTGIYIFESAATYMKYSDLIMRNDVRFNGEFYISAVLHAMIQDGMICRALRIQSADMVSLGTPGQVQDYVDSIYAFLFDLDGTLVNTEGVYKQVWNVIMKKDLPDARFKHLSDSDLSLLFDTHVSGNNDHIALCQLLDGQAVTQQLVSKISLRKDELFIRAICALNHGDQGITADMLAIRGAIAFIRAVCCDTAHPVAIVTNCNRAVAEFIVCYLNLTKYIDLIVVGNECARPKPHPDPYLKALNLLGLPRDRAIIFEDSNSGLLSARSVSPKCVVQILSARNVTAPKSSLADFHHIDFSTMSISKLLDYDCQEKHATKKMLHRSLERAACVDVDDCKAKGGYIADVVHVHIRNTDNSALRAVYKYQNHDNTTQLAKMAHALDLYEREYLFYKHIRDDLDRETKVRSPKCYGIISDESGKNNGVLLEYLSAPRFALNLDLNTERLNVTLKIVTRMAEMHAHFRGCSLRYPALRRNNDLLFRPTWTKYIQDQWPLFKEKWASFVGHEDMQLGNAIVSEFDTIQLLLSQGDDLTLIHGDIKSPNIFYDTENDNEPYFIDWQYVAYGKGVQDLAFFLIESFDTSFLQTNIKSIVQGYSDAYLAASGTCTSSTQIEQDLWLASKYYPFFVAVWFGTTPVEDLIDVNFPPTFIRKLFAFYKLVQ